MSIDKFRVNGNVVSWGSGVLRVGGEELTFFTGIAFGQKRDRQYVYGQDRSQMPRGRTRGKYEPKPIKLTIPRGAYGDVIEFLKAKAPDGVSYGDVEVTIVSQWIEKDETPHKIEAFRCTIIEEDAADEEGPDPMKDEVTFMPMSMKRNGGTLFDSTKR